jgi:hypothetical protein
MRFRLLEDELHSCIHFPYKHAKSNNIPSEANRFWLLIQLGFSARAMISIFHPSRLVHFSSKINSLILVIYPKRKKEKEISIDTF